MQHTHLHVFRKVFFSYGYDRSSIVSVLQAAIFSVDSKQWTPLTEEAWLAATDYDNIKEPQPFIALVLANAFAAGQGQQQLSF